MTVNFDQRPGHLRYLQAASRVLTRTDRILSGRSDLAVAIETQGGPAPAWTDGTTISLRSGDWARTYEDEGATARLLGLNYHELCHVLFTPREGHRAWTMLQSARTTHPNIMNVYNLAEDQRIETLFSTTYRPAAAFFTQAVLDLIIQDGQEANATWVLIAGRRYLPDRLRTMSRKAYTGDAAEWEGLVNRYLLVDWEADAAEGIDILKQMHDHLLSQGVQPPPSCGTPALSRGNPDHDATEDATEQVAKDIADDEADDTEATDAEGDEADEDTEGTESDEDTEGTESDEDTEGTESDEDTDQAEGDGDGASSDEAPADEDEAKDLADWDETLEEIEAEAETVMAREAKQVEGQIEIEIEQSDAPLGSHFPRHSDRVPVTDAAMALAGELEGVLGELRMEVDPGWMSHRSQGRINVYRYLSREAWEPMDEVFDEWNMGAEEALDIETAILVDTSSSMGYGHTGKISPSRAVAEGAWALKKALGNHDIPVAVLGFDSRTTLIYESDEEADAAWMPKPLAGGSTNPGPGLVEIGRHFNYSGHRRRIVVVLTDGQFPSRHRMGGLSGREVELSDIVRSIDAEVRVLLRYGAREHWTKDTWGFDEVQDIHDIDQMVEACRVAIVEGVKRTGIQEVTWH